METAVPMAERDVTIEGALRGTVTEPAAADRRAWIVLLHGFGGHRDEVGGMFAKLAPRLAERGFAVLRFDFPGCGGSPGEFGDVTVGRYIEAALAAIRHVRSARQSGTRTGLLGFSFGGAIAAACAHQLADIDALALWAPVGNPKVDMIESIGAERAAEAERRGWAELDWGARKIRLKRAFFASLADVAPLDAVAPFAGDLFVAAGTRDRLVKYVPLIYAAARKARSVTPRTMTDADHFFAATDPKPGGHLDWLVGETVEFFVRAFRR